MEEFVGVCFRVEGLTYEGQGGQARRDTEKDEGEPAAEQKANAHALYFS